MVYRDESPRGLGVLTVTQKARLAVLAKKTKIPPWEQGELRALALNADQADRDLIRRLLASRT